MALSTAPEIGLVGVYPLSMSMVGMRSVSACLLLAVGCACSAGRTEAPDAKTATLACRSAVAAKQAATKLDFTTAASDIHLAVTLALEIPLGSKYPNVHNAGVGVKNDTNPTQVVDDVAAFLEACHDDAVKG
jgi:hypothetical protein